MEAGREVIRGRGRRMTALLRLSWPPRALWPNRSNGRSWTVKKDDKAAAIEEADIVAYGQIGALREIQSPQIAITFHKADAGRYDLDGAYSAMKHQLDAICRRWGRDDSIIDDVRLRKGGPVKGGCVMIEISERGTWQHIGMTEEIER